MRAPAVAIAGTLAALLAAGCHSSSKAPKLPPSLHPWVYFRPVECVIGPYASPTTTTTAPPSSLFGALGASAAESTTTTTSSRSAGSTHQANPCRSGYPTSPTTPPGQDAPQSTVVLPFYQSDRRYVLGPADLTGAALAKVSLVAPTAAGTGWSVQLSFTPSGKKAFDQVAALRFAALERDPSNPPVESLEAVDVDGVVVTAPVLDAPSFPAGAVVAGPPSRPFTKVEAELLVEEIRLAASRP